MAISSEIVIDKLVSTLLKIVIEHAGAQKAFLILSDDGQLRLHAQGHAGPVVKVMPCCIDINEQMDLPLPRMVLQYVARTLQVQLLPDAREHNPFSCDPYIVREQPLSVLCQPIVQQGKLSGILYLENNLIAAAFSEQRLELLALLSSQAAIAISNAHLYANLEEKVTQRTVELRDALGQLNEQHQQLKTTQAQLVLSEKMASLGQLVANVAHEINTPIAAIKASGHSIETELDGALNALPKLFLILDQPHQALFLHCLALARTARPTCSSREERVLKRQVRTQLEELSIGNERHMADLLVEMGIQDALSEYLPLLRHPESEFIMGTCHGIGLMLCGTRIIHSSVERMSRIVFSLKSFARTSDVSEMCASNLRECLETVLLIYQSQIRQGYELNLQFESVAPVLCLENELNQVWSNLIQNALQAMSQSGTLTIRLTQVGQEVIVAVSDTGCGMTDDVMARIFEPFFTTKPVGEGCGLGLNIANKIVETHQGRIEVQSETGCGSTFSVYLPLNRQTWPPLVAAAVAVQFGLQPG